MKKIIFPILMSGLLVFGSFGSALATTFSDVTTSAWYYDYVEELVEQGILSGYIGDTFHPEENLTRSQAVKLVVMGLVDESLWSTAYEESFDDVYSSAWYASYVATAEDLGLIEQGDEFEPDQPIDRAAFTKLIVLGIGLDQEGDSPSDESDYDDVDSEDWYHYYIQLATEEELVSGYGNDTFQPGQLVNRAEASKMIILAQNYQEDAGVYFDDDWELEVELEDEEDVVAIDCEDDFSCFVDASELCGAAGVIFETVTEYLDAFIYTIDVSMEIEESDDACELSITYESIETDFTEEYIDLLMEDEGMTEEEVEETLVEINEDLSAEYGEEAGMCTFEGDELYDIISQWDPDEITLYDFDDFGDSACDGI